jgi:hypothetical protein
LPLRIRTLKAPSSDGRFFLGRCILLLTFRNAVYRKLRGLARQDLINPGPGFVRRLEQGCVPGVALAEPRLQVPPTLVLRVMVRSIEADNHGGELAVREDQIAVGIVAVNEDAHRHECNVEGHGLRLQVGAKGQLPIGQIPKK